MEGPPSPFVASLNTVILPYPHFICWSVCLFLRSSFIIMASICCMGSTSPKLSSTIRMWTFQGRLVSASFGFLCISFFSIRSHVLVYLSALYALALDLLAADPLLDLSSWSLYVYQPLMNRTDYLVEFFVSHSCTVVLAFAAIIWSILYECIFIWDVQGIWLWVCISYDQI